MSVAELQWIRRLLLMIVTLIDRKLCEKGAAPVSERPSHARS